MFTGIIEEVGVVKTLKKQKGNLQIEISSKLSKSLKVDQSISHNGVCLTVIKKSKTTHVVTAVQETLDKTNLNTLKSGQMVNLERALVFNSRLDGHLVSGHVDCKATLQKIIRLKGSIELQFELPSKFSKLIILKGSIAINGISLTVSNLKKKSFSTVIIPFTWEHTNLNQLKLGDFANLEFDLIGKYIQRGLSLKGL